MYLLTALPSLPVPEKTKLPESGKLPQIWKITKRSDFKEMRSRACRHFVDQIVALGATSLLSGLRREFLTPRPPGPPALQDCEVCVLGCVWGVCGSLSLGCRPRGSSMAGPKLDQPHFARTSVLQARNWTMLRFSGGNFGHETEDVMRIGWWRSMVVVHRAKGGSWGP